MQSWKAKPKTFTVRQREDRGRIFWQIGENIIADASYYNGSFAKRCFDKFVSKGLAPEYIDGATEPKPEDIRNV